MRSKRRPASARLFLAISLLLAPMFAHGALAAVTDTDYCIAAKLKIVGKYDSCVMKAQSAALTAGTVAVTTPCLNKLLGSWSAPEKKYGAACPVAAGSALAVLGNSHLNEVLAALGSSANLCGNGVVDAGEACDGSSAGLTCPSDYLGGTPGCQADCTIDVSSCLLCDLFAQDCNSGRGCYPTLVSPVCADQSASSKLEDEPCTYVNDCAPGFTCANLGSGEVCHQICRASGGSPSCATVGKTCVATPPLGADVGLCD